MLLWLYTIVLFVRIILSWVTMGGARFPDAIAPIVKFVYDVTEPVLGLFRRMLPPLGMIDLSPLIVFLVLGVARSALGCGGFL